MGAPIGPHIIGSPIPYLESLRRWQPNLVTVVDPSGIRDVRVQRRAVEMAMRAVPKSEIRELRETCPRTKILLRLYIPEGDLIAKIRANPEAAAVWADQHVRVHPAFGVVDYWQIANEIMQESPEDVTLLTRFEKRRIELAGAEYGVAAFGWSIGQPDLPENDRLFFWRITYPVLNLLDANPRHVLCCHQYGAGGDLWGPVIKGGAPWCINRMEQQVLPRLPQKRFQVVVSEYGYDGGVEPGQPLTGYRVGYHGEEGSRPAQYAADLIKMSAYLQQFSDRIIGYTVYTFGTGGDAHWQSFESSGEVEKVLADYYASRPPAPPPAPIPQPDPQPEQLTLEDLRNTACAMLYPVGGIPYTPAHALFKHAKRHGLGGPLSREFSYGPWTAQAFANGLVYAVTGRWNEAQIAVW